MPGKKKRPQTAGYGSTLRRFWVSSAVTLQVRGSQMLRLSHHPYCSAVVVRCAEARRLMSLVSVQKHRQAVFKEEQ